MKKDKPHKIFIYGKHALAEAIAHAPKSVRKVYLASTCVDENLHALLSAAHVPTAALKDGALREVESGATHQGIIAEVSLAGLIQTYDPFVKNLTVSQDTLLVVLDELTDPHNVGAIIRSAAAFGASGILLPQHNQAPITGAVVKVSAGMAFRVPLVQIGNVNQAIRDLKERGFWIYGLAGDGSQSLTEEEFSAPTVLVVGSEGAGIRHRTRELCDVMLSIPIAPRTESLNAASATSVAFYAWSVRHKSALN